VYLIEPRMECLQKAVKLSHVHKNVLRAKTRICLIESICNKVCFIIYMISCFGRNKTFVSLKANCLSCKTFLTKKMFSNCFLEKDVVSPNSYGSSGLCISTTKKSTLCQSCLTAFGTSSMLLCKVSNGTT
jgi:hypothetical protein